MQNNSSKFKISFKFLVLVFSFSFFAFSLASETSAANASLYLSPPSGTYAIGSTFSVKIKVNSGGETINAAEGILIFNSDEISVVKISKSGSIFTLWTTEPVFSNSAGSIVFGGGTPAGFTGNSGTIISITFKAKTVSSAQVNFSSGSILAADGKGTNILGNMNGGVYTLKPKITTPPAEEIPAEEDYVPPVTVGIPTAPIIFSTTHSDPSKWYSNNEPEFSWKVPSDITAVKLLIGKKPTAIPNVLYSPPISEKKIEDLADDVWYFHIRFKNQYGWGGVLHRKVLIDTEAPESFKIAVDNESDSTNPNPILYFATTDSLSGIEYYEVKIGEKDAVQITAAAIKTNPYKMPSQIPGKHTIIVKAFDKAGNSTIDSIDIIIEPIEAPLITDFSQTFQIGDILNIKGTSEYSGATVTVFVKKEGEEAITDNIKTDSEGNWLYIHSKSLEKGTYQIWAEITDERGAKSNPTEKITISAALPALLKFGRIAIDYLSIIVTLIALIIVLIGIGFYSWHRVSVSRRKLRKETKEVAQSVAKAFRALREEVQEQIEYLDKKPGLTKGEKKVREKLQEALNISEEFIGKEIKDIEKELE